MMKRITKLLLAGMLMIPFAVQTRANAAEPDPVTIVYPAFLAERLKYNDWPPIKPLNRATPVWSPGINNWRQGEGAVPLKLSPITLSILKDFTEFVLNHTNIFYGP